MKRLLAGLLTVVVAAASAACSSDGSESGARGETVTGVMGVDGSSWDVELLAVVRGTTTEDRGAGQPCLVVFGVLKAATPGEFRKPVALPVTRRWTAW